MGHHNRHFAGDRYSNAGVWGAPTSTANFCEEDYAVTLYIAEFVNTLTNLAYIYFAVRYPGLPAAVPETEQPEQPDPPKQLDDQPKQPGQPTQGPRPPPPRREQPSWTRPDFFARSMWVLGLLSAAFHATLKHRTQYGDEIAMLVLGGALLQGAWGGVRTRGPRRAVAAAVSWSAVAVAAALYLRTGQILHQVYAFQGMLFFVGTRTLYRIVRWPHAHAQAHAHAHAHRASRRHLLLRYLASTGVLSLAYFIWFVDLETCGTLRRLRAAVGLPWAWLLELHGWWHIGTALGASLFINLLRDMDD